MALVLSSFTVTAQVCPPNIDFETGTFTNWTCYIGNVSANGNVNNINLVPVGGPVFDRQTMYAANQGGLDPYGGFPVNCPNGSGFSIRLGNDKAGGEAEGISYEFVIPANQPVYSLIYHYAVVFQDPNHQQFQQPRMEIEITNVTDGELISCSSFTFIPYGSILPGFFESSSPRDSTPVWCKNWSAVSINLDGNAGKRIRLFFKTADCTFIRHFGYAYIDVNSECTSEFVGATYCPDDTAINVIAPYGYQSYTWYNSTFTQVLGNQQTLTLAPPPPVGTVVAVEVIPYNGYGCLDTLYAKLIDTLTVVSNAGADITSCNLTPVQIGANSKPGLVYTWTPSNYLNNPRISNPVANPPNDTYYTLLTNNFGGGCKSYDTVLVRSSQIDNSLLLVGKAAFCIDSDDSAVLVVHRTDSIQWYRDDRAIDGANDVRYRVPKTGTYYAILFNKDGCVSTTEKQYILIDKPRPGINYKLQYALINYPLTLQARDFGEIAIWSPGTYLNTTNSFTPIFTSGAEQQLYTITITTSSGCVTVDTQLVKTVKKIDIMVPNAFTPNNDGLNDYLHPILMGVTKLNYFRVYNRWGQLLYESSNELPGWNGKIKGVEQGSGVVVWMAEGLGVDERIYRRKGTAVLIR